MIEQADHFVKNACTSTAAQYKTILQRLNDLQFGGLNVRPMSEEDASQTPILIPITEAEVFDMDIEEHAFMLDSSTFTEQYRFASDVQGFVMSYHHFLYLTTDCALLHVMCNAQAYHRAGMAGSRISLSSVEQRAYWHACELCRCVHFWSKRFLTAARFLRLLLQAARNFFGSYGAIAEMQWAHGCSLTTERRIERLRRSSPATLCRLSDVTDQLAQGCRYGPLVDGVIVGGGDKCIKAWSREDYWTPKSLPRSPSQGSSCYS